MTVTDKTGRLSAPVDAERDHILGNPNAEITLVEYGSYSCKYCHAAHEVIADLRDRFGDRMRYVFRQLPIKGSDMARPAAELAEFAAQTGENFWKVHNELMIRGPEFTPTDFEEIAERYGLQPDSEEFAELKDQAAARVDEDRASARESGVRATPTFFINGRRYEGAWDEHALAEAMLGSLGHRIQSAALDFVRWGPSTGVLLLLMSILAIVLSNTAIGPEFQAFWQRKFALGFGDQSFSLSLFKWINDGLLTLFFLVVGLEIKKEFTVGHLSTRRKAAFPVAAALGGMLVPALLYMLLAPRELFGGWGIPMATDTAFAIALIVFLGNRVPVELRVFLTAAVIVDDIVAILVVAIFYSGELSLYYMIASALVVGILIVLNRWNVYRPLPYAIAGLFLWFFIHEAGLHATLAGVVLAILTPTHPPGNLGAMLAQAENILLDETKHSGEEVLRHGPSEPAMRALDTIFDRIESPADKLLRNLEPWSSYFVLPLFALANAGVAISVGVFSGNGFLFAAIIAGLVVGKPLGIVLFSYLAVKLKFADKPAEYNWRQVVGVGALAGIGFTMSLFIAGQAFPDPNTFAAAKIAIFMASILAGIVGVIILFPKAEDRPDEQADLDELHTLNTD